MTNNALSAVRVRAHAKINLNLRVLGRRADLYHDLRTVFQVLALHDTLTLTLRPGPFSIDCADARVPIDSTNLVWRAADLLWQHLQRDGHVRGVGVHIEKRIPMNAGLGGGSADGAAALLGFARLWQPQLPAEDLAALGRQLGADVAFFFTGGAALGVARGDQIQALSDLVPLGVLLVIPPFDVSTADAYRWLDEDRGRACQAEAPAAARRTVDASPGELRRGSLQRTRARRQVGQVGQVGDKRSPAPLPAQTIPHCAWPSPDCDIANDFEPVVAARHPQVTEIVRALVGAGAVAAAMTGSGSAVFGLFEGAEALSRAARTVADAGYSVERTRTLTRGEYLRASAPACL